MADQQSFKYFPLHHFLYQSTAKNRILFLMFFALIMLAGFAAVFAFYSPHEWTIKVNEVSQEQMHEVVIGEVTSNYRTIDQKADVFSQIVNYTASPIVPDSRLVWIFVIVSALGWALFMSAASTIKNYWCYPFYFIFLVYLHVGEFGRLVWPGQGLIAEIILVIFFLGFAYLFQQKILKVNTLVRVLIFTAIWGIVIALIHKQGGYAAIHESTVTAWPMLLILTLFGIWYVSKEPVNMILVLLTQRKDEKQRPAPFPLTIGLLVSLFVLFFIMMMHHTSLDWFDASFIAPVRPIWFLVAAAIFSPFTSQNVYAEFKKTFTISGFPLLIAAIMLIMLVYLFFMASLTEYLFITLVERMTSVFFFISTGFILIYLLLNYMNALKTRSNFYYHIYKAKKLNYFFVLISTVFFTFLLEGRNQPVNVRYYSSILENRRGDQNLITGRQGLAFYNYQNASLYSTADVKSNYNLGSITLARTSRPDSAMLYFQKSNEFFDFPLGSLNSGAAAYGYYGNRNTLAVDLYRTALQRRFHPLLASNLAMVKLGQNQPDSSVYWLKQALLEEPDHAGFYANLAMVYQYFGKPEAAREFLAAGLKAEDASPVLISDIVYYNLTHGDSIEIPRKKGKAATVESPEGLYNMAMQEYVRGNYAAAKSFNAKVLAQNEPPYAILLDGMIKLAADSFSTGVSRLVYLASSWPSYQSKAWYQIGLAYFRHGVPEMAAHYFGKAADAGMNEALLLQMYTTIDAGNFEFADNLIRLIRSGFEQYYSEASKESAMILKAYGLPDLAYTDWDFEGITFNEKVRISLYAGKLKNYIAALENFRDIIGEDSTTVIPYLEMGRIYLADGDSMAIPNLAYGLKFDPDNRELATELARAYLTFGEGDRGTKMADSLYQIYQNQPDVALLKAQAEIFEGDTAEATNMLRQLHDAYPLKKDVIYNLASVLLLQGKAVEGYELIYYSLKLNDQDAGLWFYFAHFARMLGQIEDAGYGAFRAIETSHDEAQQLKIAEEFAAELRYFSEPEP